jgi:hypothetical protein
MRKVIFGIWTDALEQYRRKQKTIVAALVCEAAFQA